jgi:hypothetical protein
MRREEKRNHGAKHLHKTNPDVKTRAPGTGTAQQMAKEGNGFLEIHGEGSH